MATKDKDLNDLFLDTLKDIYFAEKQILKALPKMARAAQSPDGTPLVCVDGVGGPGSGWQPGP